MNTQTAQTKETKSIVTVSVCMPAKYVKILDAYRNTETYKPGRSKVVEIVMSEWLDKKLQEMPWLASESASVAQAMAVAPVTEAKESSTERALALIASTANEPVSKANKPVEKQKATSVAHATAASTTPKKAVKAA